MSSRVGVATARWVALGCVLVVVASAAPVRADGWDYVYGDPGPANYSRYQDVEIAPDGSVFVAGFYSGTFNGLSSPDAYRYFVQHIASDGSTAWTRELNTAVLPSLTVPAAPDLAVDGLGNPIVRIDNNWYSYTPTGTLVMSAAVGTSGGGATPGPTAQLVPAGDGGVVSVAFNMGGATTFELQRRRADLSLQWAFDLSTLMDLNGATRPAVMAVSDGTFWVVGQKNRTLATQPNALSMVHVSATGSKITSILHFGLVPATAGTMATSPLLAASDSFIWVTVQVGDSFVAPIPIMAFATSDGHQLGVVSNKLSSDDITTSQGVVNCGPQYFGAENSLDQGPATPPTVNRRTVLVNGTRLLVIARCADTTSLARKALVLLSYAITTPLGGYSLIASRELAAASTIYGMDADDAGNAIVVGSTTNGIVYSGPIERVTPRTEVGGNEQAVATRNPLGNLNDVGEYEGLTPIRMFDTRPSEGNGAVLVPKFKIGGASVLTVSVAGKLGVPAVGAGAVSLNVTVVDPSGSGYLTVYPCGTPPTASNLNFTAGQTVANAVVAPLSAKGEICFASNVPTYVLADINGWFRAGLGFTAVTPVRVFDTRPEFPQGAVPVDQHPYGGASELKVKVAGIGGVPLTNVGAVSLNVTAVGPAGSGFVTVYPCGTRPNASNLNFVAGQTVPNAVIAPVSATGEICLYSSVDTHLLADVNGWFALGSSFHALVPVRIVDTRSTEGDGAVAVAKVKYGPGALLRFKIAGAGGVPATGVGAVALNVTVVDSDGAGFLTAFPCGNQPLASNINFTAGQTVPNAVVVPVSRSGEVCFFANTPAHILVDANGWISL